MEIGFERGHVAHHKAAVLVNGVAAHGRGFFGHPFGHKGQKLLFHFGFGVFGCAHALGEAGAAVGGGVPFVHGAEHFIALVDGIHFGLRQHV